jgi:hypothetical protein
MTALRQALDENVTFSRSFRYVLFVTAQGQAWEHREAKRAWRLTRRVNDFVVCQARDGKAPCRSRYAKPKFD